MSSVLQIIKWVPQNDSLKMLKMYEICHNVSLVFIRRRSLWHYLSARIVVYTMEEQKLIMYDFPCKIFLKYDTHTTRKNHQVCKFYWYVVLIRRHQLVSYCFSNIWYFGKAKSRKFFWGFVEWQMCFLIHVWLDLKVFIIILL